MAGSPILEHVGDRNSVDGGARQIGLLDPEPGEVDVVNAPARHIDIVERAARHVDVMKVAAGQIHVFEARPREIGFMNVETLFCTFDLHIDAPEKRDGHSAPINVSPETVVSCQSRMSFRKAAKSSLCSSALSRRAEISPRISRRSRRTRLSGSSAIIGPPTPPSLRKSRRAIPQTMSFRLLVRQNSLQFRKQSVVSRALFHLLEPRI